MAETVVLYEIDDKVSVITLNRPDKLNAISPELMQQLLGAFARADEEPATSVVLLRAEGRSFCAGYDIGAGPASPEWRSDPIKAHKHLAPQLAFEMTPWHMKKPVIAAVQGHVMGGGCELVMLCDLTIAADSATFAEPEVRFSSVGPAIVMPAIIGYKRARELLYFGDEALYATKLAINRGADAAGFSNRINAGLDAVAPLYATKTEFGQRFREIVEKEGVPAAVRWRAAQFRE